jgi:heme/copper-type cytochrome/quinol oxidase subunit 2
VGIGTSIFLIAVGAILKYAVTADVSGVDLGVVGVILMVVGIVGLVLSFLWMTIWADRRRHAVVADRAVVAEPPARERVVERDPY